MLSPIDWAMIEGWRERGIPLHIVIRAIESVFDKFDQNPSPRTIKGLLYCREEVEAQYIEWSASQVGSSGSDQSEPNEQLIDTTDILRHISEAVTKLKEIRKADLDEEIKRAIGRLEELSENLNHGLEIIDRSLGDIENFLDQALLSKSHPEHLKLIERQIATQLKSYKNDMDKDAFEQTRRLLILKRLREELNIPRLGLFYL